MCPASLLVLSNATGIKSKISTFVRSIKCLYIHLNFPDLTVSSPPLYGKMIASIYREILSENPDLDVRILVSNLKLKIYGTLPKKPVALCQQVESLYVDRENLTLCDLVKKSYNISSPVHVLPGGVTSPAKDNVEKISDNLEKNGEKIYDTVVLGGTFDRIHLGHKVLLTEAVLRAKKKLIVGVTDENMIKNKVLWELILPVEERIKSVKEFLNDIDHTLQYEIVPISDPFGPTKTDPCIDMIIVSAETLRGGHKVNEVRAENGLKQLDIKSIDVIEDDLAHFPREKKISSSNSRVDLLGTRLRPPRVNPREVSGPYVIGLCGGIASGKSTMAQRFEKYGATIIYADPIGHYVYEPGQSCYQKLINHFGKDILDDNGKINRSKLGSIVFKDSKQLIALNGIVWPEMLKEVKLRLKAAARKNVKVVIIEAAVLLMANWDEFCHEIWATIVSRKEAIKRVQMRNKLSEEEAERRVNAQMDNKSIVDRSNIVFCSEWDLQIAEQQAKKAWDLLMSDLQSKTS